MLTYIHIPKNKPTSLSSATRAIHHDLVLRTVRTPTDRVFGVTVATDGLSTLKAPSGSPQSISNSPLVVTTSPSRSASVSSLASK